MSDTTNFESHVKILSDERDLALDRLERMFGIYKEYRTEVHDDVREAMSAALITMVKATTTFLTEALDGGQSDS